MDQGSGRPTVSTRAILIALLIFNVVAIGLSEVQRRALTRDNTELLMQLRQFEVQKRNEEILSLDHENRLLAELAARVNHVEILAGTLPATANRITKIDKRLRDAPLSTLVCSRSDQKAPATH